MEENVIYKATIETDNSSKIYIGLSAKLSSQPAKKTFINTQYHNKKQTKRKKLPPVQTSNRTFKISSQIKKRKPELQNKLENTTKGEKI